ncbi:MAG TPA: hypothetical protein VGB88_08765 [Alphaproteobacteria bacterium]
MNKATTATRTPGLGVDEAERAELHRYIRHIDRALNRLWNLGRNLVVGWHPAEAGLRVLVIPHHMLRELAEQDGDLLCDGHRVTHARLDALGRQLGIEPIQVRLPNRPGRPGIAHKAIESVVRRYSVTKSNHRAAILLDIVGFSLYSPLEQVTLLNSLAFSINVAQSRALANKLRIDVSRSTTGDGFYVWNRDEGLEADVNLFYLMMLVLADNALARHKGAPSAVPVLRSCFHLGSHYEYYPADGLNPSVTGFIVGDLTIELARMVGKALPGQVLIGQFTRPKAGVGGHAGALSTLAFVSRAQDRLDQLHALELSGQRITAIKCYLTGKRIGGGVYSITKYALSDKHGRQRNVFNAKVNIYRGDADVLYLGLENKDLERFDAEAAEPRTRARPGVRASVD